eukprot:432492_1
MNGNNKERLNTDTIDIDYKYKLTSSSMSDCCPPEIDPSNTKPQYNIIKYDDIYSKKQIKLLNITTHVALTSLIAMITSFVYQLLWFVRLKINKYKHIIWFTHISCIDALISTICIYLQLEISKGLYKKLCINTNICCKCHKCCFKFIYKITQKKTQYNKDIRNVHAVHNLQTANSQSIE